MGKLKAVIWFIAILALVSSAFALEFEVTITPEAKSLRTNESTIFDLTISHDSNFSQNFEIYTPQVQWDVVTDPISDRLIEVYENEKRIARLVIRPLGVNPGYYVVPIHVRLLGTSNISKTNLLIGLTSPFIDSGEYIPAIRVLVNIPENIDPRNEVEILVSLENQNVKVLDDVIVKIRSNLINQDYKTSLGSLEKKQVTFNAILDPQTTQQEDLLRVSVISNTPGKSYQFDSTPKKYNIIEFGDLTETEKLTKGFLRTRISTVLENNGNSNKMSDYFVKKNFFKDIFTSFNIRPDSKIIDGKEYWVWNELVPIRTSLTITQTTSYRLPFWVIISVLIIYILYYLLRSPLIITKSAIVLNTKEGGTTEFKVILELKNRSPHKLKNVDIHDKIPKIAEIIREFEVGSLSPTKIMKHPTKGTLVKFSLDEVDKFEERIITYKVKSKLSILGSMTLPMATIKFMQGRNHRKSVSNSAHLSLVTKR